MNKKNTKGFYASPLVKVKELQAWQMLCQSKMGDQGFGLDNDGQLGDGGEL